MDLLGPVTRVKKKKNRAGVLERDIQEEEVGRPDAFLERNFLVALEHVFHLQRVLRLPPQKNPGVYSYGECWRGRCRAGTIWIEVM